MIPMKRPSIDKTRGKHGSHATLGQRIAQQNKPQETMPKGSVPAQRGDQSMATPAARYLEGSNTVQDGNYDYDGGADTGGNLDQMEGSQDGDQNIPQMKGRRMLPSNLRRMAR